MRAAGLITEFNPLHKGHVYYMKMARQNTGADVLFAVMSGDYVQRGEPAIWDKYSRAAAAVDAGADIIIELPVYHSLSSAENFASGAISALSKIGVSDIVFGSECGDISRLLEIAHILNNENADYSIEVKKYVSQGMSYPKARQEALIKLYDIPSDILSTPNNILGIEYLRAIEKNKYNINPVAIKRTDNNYNSVIIEGSFPGATSIRELIRMSAEKNYNLNTDYSWKQYLAPSMKNVLNQCEYGPIFENDFSTAVFYRLNEIMFRTVNKKEFCRELQVYRDISDEIANRIYNTVKKCNLDGRYLSLDEFANMIKTKQYTLSRIKRCMFNIVLGINKKSCELFYKSDMPYIRILAANCVGRKYLKEMRKNFEIPVITKAADYSDLLAADIHAANIYNLISLQKYKKAPLSDYKNGALMI